MSDVNILKKAYITLKETKSELARLRGERHEPIAIIGMACEFPGGVETLEDYWSLLERGGEGISDVPPDRWAKGDYYDTNEDAPGKMYTRRAGFLERDVYGFDAEFFGLTPKEARAMDPQHRLFIEGCWRAMEDAGLDVSQLKGSRTGVFAGISGMDYVAAHLHSGDLNLVDAYSVTGIAFSTLTGRVSYLFGFEGPSMAVDTACSSSLVSLHLAVQSLRRRECDLALVGGVNLILNPEIHVGFSKLKGISRDGRCKTFSKDADGHGRGEGVGVIVLRRLSDAQDKLDAVRGIIRGTAVNQDGRSVGFTAPNGRSQERVIREALLDGLVSAEEVAYVEAHGTGTPLGDPIEMDALNRTYCSSVSGRGETPLVVGSVKANMGHLEAAAGIAGIIKSILMLERRRFVPQINISAPNPHIPWSEMPIRISDPAMNWQTHDEGATLLSAVSAFGFSGTNAHIILESARADSGDSLESESGLLDRDWEVVCLAAKSRKALASLSQRLSDQVESGSSEDASLKDLAFSSRHRRTMHRVRCAVAASTKTELIEGLRQRVGEIMKMESVAGELDSESRPQIAFLFTGQGSQYFRMGRELYEGVPVFRDAFERCDRWLRVHADLSVIELVYEDETESSLHRTANTQPVIFSIGYALSEMWRYWGIEPDAVLGHSIGEFVAACVAGVFSLEDALLMVATRGRLIQQLPEDGAMGVVVANAKAVAEVMESVSGCVTIAADNAPENTVISGDAAAVDQVLKHFKRRNIPARRLRISHAIHSPKMETILDAFEKAVAQVAFHPPRLPIHSNVTGCLIGDEIASVAYWREQIVKPVRFREAIQRLHASGCSVFLEIGGVSTLSSLGVQCLPGSKCTWLPSLGANSSMFNMLPNREEGHSDWKSVMTTLGALFTLGLDVHWAKVDEGRSFSFERLPGHPFFPVHFRVDAPVLAMPQQSGLVDSVRDGQVEHQTESKSDGGAAHSNPHNDEMAFMREETCLNLVKRMVQEVSGLSESALTGELNWLELGLDSLMIARLREQALSVFQVEVEMSAFFEDASTPRRLADYLKLRMPATANKEPSVGSRTNSSGSLVGDENRFEPGDVPVSNDHSKIKDIFAQQLKTVQDLIDRQLDVLRQSDTSSGGGAAALPDREALERMTRSANARSMVFDKDSLTTEQQGFLERFIQRYNAKTAKSKTYTQQNRRVFVDWINSLGFRRTLKELIYPIVSDGSKGSKIRDIDGNEYIDLAIGYGVSFFGHGFEPVVNSVCEQMQRGYDLGPQSKTAADVARLISKITGVERVAFGNTGSEAVMIALRLARTVTQKNHVVMFAGSYHGISDGALALPALNGRSAPSAFGIPPEMVHNVTVLPYGTQEAIEAIESMAGQLAAVLVEPVQSRRPGFQPREFLHQVRKITEENGVILIFDEMLTGFRIQPDGAQGYFGVQADLVTYGKVVGGGFPIGVVAGKAEVMDAVDGGPWEYGDDSIPDKDVTFFAGTFCKHPVTMAAAYAVLNHIDTLGAEPYMALRERSQAFVDRLNTFFTSERLPFEANCFGPMFRLEATGRYHLMLQPLELDLLFYLLMEKGVYTWERRICSWSFAHTQADFEAVYQAIVDSVAELRSGGFKLEISSKESGATPMIDGTVNPSNQNLALTSLPASAAQRRIHALDHLEDSDSEPQAYQMQAGYWISGEIDFERMAWVIQEIGRRHEALRTRFYFEDGQLWQRIDESVPFHLERKESESLSPQDWINKFRERFHLESGGLFRAWIVDFTESRNQHLLLLGSHHIVIDGISWNLIGQEFAAIYAGQSLPYPSHQYQDFCIRMNDRAVSEQAERSRQFWGEQFAGEVPVLDLPTDFVRPRERSSQGGSVHVTVPEETVANLRALGRKEGLSMFMILFGGFNLLLHRLTGQTDLVVGTPVGGRPSIDFDRTVGMFANTLAIRTGVDPENTVLGYLRHVRSVMAKAGDHQDYPLELLSSELNLERDPSRSGLVDALLVYEQGDARVWELEGLEVESYPIPKIATMFDLALEIIEQKGKLEINFDYSTALFEASTIERWAAYYVRLLSELPGFLESSPSEIDFLSDDERTKQLEQWSCGPRMTLGLEESILERLSAHASATPDAIALACDQETWTYEMLERKLHLIALKLNRTGVGQGDRVILCGKRRSSTVAGILGIMRAGAAYVPIDLDLPSERQRRMIEVAKPSAILVDPSLDIRFDYFDGPVLTIDFESVSEHDDSNELPRISANDTAYIIFTSGSTGEPKGVVINHGNLTYSNQARRVYYGDRFVTGMISVASFGFDMAIASVFWPLYDGGILILPRDGGQSDVHYLLQLVKRWRPSHWLSVPSLYALLLGETDLNANSGLKTVVVAGEICPIDLIKLHNKRLPGVPVHNEFGPAEGTVWCNVERVDHLDYGKLRSVPIGKPIAETRCYLLNHRQALIPQGAVGELCIAGPGVAQGYLDLPEITKHRFLENPYHQGVWQRLYRTGDLARYRPGGSIEFVGRMEGVLKVGGRRVEISEIERVMLAVEGVEEAIVIPKTSGDNIDQASLVGFVTLRDNNGSMCPTEQAMDLLRERLEHFLPNYMVPSELIVLDTIPRNLNGKADRKRLAQMDCANAKPTVATEARWHPSTPKELALVEVWQDVLGVKEVASTDSFISLGGDSIKSIQVVARLQSKGYRLTASELFRKRTVQKVAVQMVRHSDTNRECSPLGDIRLGPIHQWFFDSFPELEQRCFCQATVVRFGSKVVLEHVSQAWGEVICHHDVLRMHVQRDAVGRPGLYVPPSVNPEAPSVDLFELESEAAVGEAIPELARRLQASLDPANTPQIRLALVRTPKEDRMLVVIHHIAVDMISWPILLEDFESAYIAVSKSKPLELPRKTASFASWTQFLGGLLGSDWFKKQLPYWQSTSTPPPIPREDRALDSSSKERNPEAFRSVSVSLDAERTRSFLAFQGEDSQIRSHELLLAAYMRILSRWTGEERVTVSLEGHGRSLSGGMGPDISRTVGWFTCMYPVASSFPAPSDNDRLRRDAIIVRNALRSIPDDGIGFFLWRWFSEEGQQIGEKLESWATFNYLGETDRFHTGGTGLLADITECPPGPDGILPGRRPQALELVASVEKGVLTLSLLYDPLHFSFETITEQAGAIREDLDQMISDFEREADLNIEIPKQHAPDPLIQELLEDA